MFCLTAFKASWAASGDFCRKTFEGPAYQRVSIMKHCNASMHASEKDYWTWRLSMSNLSKILTKKRLRQNCKGPARIAGSLWNRFAECQTENVMFLCDSKTLRGNASTVCQCNFAWTVWLGKVRLENWAWHTYEIRIRRFSVFVCLVFLSQRMCCLRSLWHVSWRALQRWADGS